MNTYPKISNWKKALKGIALVLLLADVNPPVQLQADTIETGLLPAAAIALQPAPISVSALADGILAVQQSRGSRADSVTLLDVADQLEGGRGHGAMFEQQVARQYENMGRRVSFTRTGNASTDLRVFPGDGSPMTFVQAKATQNAMTSAEECLLDGLAFAGNQVNRPKELLSGRIAFEGRIPSDQFRQLVNEGVLKSDGSPSKWLAARLTDKAARQAAGTGETATRLRGSLDHAPKLLAKYKVLPGPSTYPELVRATSESASAARQAATRLGDDAAKPIGRMVKGVRILNVSGKTLLVAGVVTGPFQIYEGVEEIRRGNLVQGGGNLAGGAAGTGASAAMLGGRLMLGSSLLAASAGIDGGLDIYTGIMTTNTTRIEMGGIKCAAAGTMAVGLATGQPVVIIIGGVAYVGEVVADNLIQFHAAEERRVVDASKLYFSRTDATPLSPDQYSGIGLSQTDEMAIRELSQSKQSPTAR